MSTVVFLADGGERIGGGHLTRCAALATDLGRAGVTTGLVAPVGAGAPGAPWESGFDSVRRAPSLSLAGTLNSPRELDGVGALVVDGVSLVAELARTGHRDRTRPLVVIDDGPGRPLDADLIVNPNLTSNSAGYRTLEGGKVLAGPRWALLGPSYRERPHAAPVAGGARRLVVTCGAADPAGLTERFVEGLALVRTQFDETVVVIGPFNPRSAAIEDVCSDVGIRTMVAPPTLRPIVEDVDLALTALGTTATELAFLGIPNLAAAVDKRQLPYLAAYEQLGFLGALGWHEDLRPDQIAASIDSLAADASRRQTMRDAGVSIVDGLGGERVAQAIVERLLRYDPKQSSNSLSEDI